MAVGGGLSADLACAPPVSLPGAVLTHGCLHAPAHTLHLPCARGHLDLLLSEQHAVCTGPAPAGIPLPVAACLLHASTAFGTPGPKQEAAVSVCTSLQGTLPVQQALASKNRSSLLKLDGHLGKLQSRPGRSIGDPEATRTLMPSPGIYPSPAHILLIKALLMSRTSPPECFRELEQGTIFLYP